MRVSTPVDDKTCTPILLIRAGIYFPVDVRKHGFSCEDFIVSNKLIFACESSEADNLTFIHLLSIADTASESI